MPKYRKRPVVVDAMFYDGTVEGMKDAIAFAPTGLKMGRVTDKERISVLIPTLEGTMECMPGDWLIRGVKGELYPCKADIFSATYVAVAEDA